MKRLPKEDLEYIIQNTSPVFSKINGKKLFITGGTGMIGSWLLESLLFAIDTLKVDIKAVVLTRSVESFAKKSPHLASHKSLEFLEGDVRTFDFPKGNFDYVMHGATSAEVAYQKSNPLDLFETIIVGTKRVLDFSAEKQIKEFLFLSSGAVYGRQPPEQTHTEEDCLIGPNPVSTSSVYGEGKRCAENLCSIYAEKHNLNIKIARCYALVGPYLPLDWHFAIGNFIKDMLTGNSIHINGDGTNFRSYIYMADLTIWLWKIFFEGKSLRPYNVGSDVAFSIKDLAYLVADTLRPEKDTKIIIAKQPEPGTKPERYVPSVTRMKTELSPPTPITLKEAIIKTANWYS